MLIEVLVSLAICIFCYLIFNKLGLKGGYILILISSFGYLYYNKTLMNVYDKGVANLIILIVSIFIFDLIMTGIIYFIYDRVPLLIYLILCTTIIYLMKCLLALICTYVTSLNVNFNNSTSFKEQVRYITSTINLNIDLINVGAQSDMISLDYSCANPNIIKKIVATPDINFECSQSKNNLGEPIYIFKLIGVNRYKDNESTITCTTRKCE